MDPLRDLFLHGGDDGPTTPPITQVGGEFFTCATPTVTMTPATDFVGISEGDFILAHVSYEFGADGKAIEPPTGWRIVWWNVPTTAVPTHPGPRCYWLYRFYDPADTTYDFTHLTANRRLCVRARAWRNVDRRVPVDYMAGARNDTELTAVGGDYAVWGQAMPFMRTHAYGALQVTFDTAIDGASQSAWYMDHAGPAFDISTVHSISFSSGNTFAVHWIGYDYLSENDEDNVILAAPATSANTGGLRAWSRSPGTMGVPTWDTSDTRAIAGQEAFSVSSGLLSQPRYHFQSAVLNPGVHAMWAMMANTTGATSFLYLKAINAAGEQRGGYWLWSGAPIVYQSGSISSYFEYPFTLLTEPSGVPSQMNAIVGGEFTVTNTQTYTFQIGLAGDAVDENSIRNDLYYSFMAGVHRADKSFFTPSGTRLDRYGRNRVGRYVPGSAPWFRDEVAYRQAFVLTPRNAPIRPMEVRAPVFPFVTGPTSAGMVQRYHLGDTQAFSYTTDRWAFPSYFASASASVETVGKYYFEVALSQLASFGAFDDNNHAVGMSPCNGDHANGFSTTDFNVAINQAGATNALRIDLFGISATGSCTGWVNGRVYGVALNFSAGTVSFYSDGSLGATFRFDTTNYQWHRVPWRPFVQPSSGARVWTTTLNVTGPFSYKPAGHVAFDWINEVSA